MNMNPEFLQRFIQNLFLLPKIGQGSALRLALYFTDNKKLAEAFTKILLEVKGKVKLCKICFNTFRIWRI